MTEDELVAVVRDAVRDEFSAAGLRVDTPDFQDAVREDMRFLRRVRQRADAVANKIGMAVILGIIGGVGWLIMQGLNFWKAN
ncbi:hypothetical protein C5748_24810 [Phyllobacterium phragmitis]|uniref:Uncharacterized protein n=1 Tax=Phyllobacterium phragmitis TaxID=2670329 RepID=A0A2S9IK22_9HYPH|nr:hypothetical protein [Phyllobacterium phragmitis]PRD40859.1 hypothetical protein C5748_24810 [Phyllobacterium phragmitis]